MPLAEDDHVVQALAPYGSDQPLHVWVVPGAERTGDHLADAQAGDPALEDVTVDGVAIPQQPSRRRVVRKRVHQLLRRPGRRGVVRNVEVDDPPPVTLAEPARASSATPSTPWPGAPRRVGPLCGAEGAEPCASTPPVADGGRGSQARPPGIRGRSIRPLEGARPASSACVNPVVHPITKPTAGTGDQVLAKRRQILPSNLL